MNFNYPGALVSELMDLSHTVLKYLSHVGEELQTREYFLQNLVKIHPGGGANMNKKTFARQLQCSLYLRGAALWMQLISFQFTKLL